MIAHQDAVAFGSWLAERVARYADRPAIEIGGITRTYAEFGAASDQLALGLAGLGVQAGSRVAVLLGNTAAHIDAWFALGKLGAIEIPVNTAYTGELLRFMLGQCRAELVICDAERLAAVAGLAAGLPSLRAIVCADSDDQPAVRSAATDGVDLHSLAALYQDGAFRPAETGPASPGVILFSSGTTGPPKGILHSNGGCVRLGRYNAEVMGYGPADVLWNCFPLFHQNARYTGVIPALDVGAKIVLEAKFSASRFWDNARAKGVTAFNYLGAVIQLLWNQPPGVADREHAISRAFGAGAPKDIWPQFEERFGVTLTEVYGLTEAPMATVNRHPGERHSCGRPSDLFEVAVVDQEDMQITGETGEIVVRPKIPCIFMLGYDNAPEVTVEAFRNLWFHTGDRGRISAGGDLYFVDRQKDCIRRRGENISSWEVESVLARHPDVLESAAYAVPSQFSDDEVMVALVPRPGTELDPAQVHEFCAGQLPAYAVPSYIRVMAGLPHTPTERVQKFRLREEGVTADAWHINEIQMTEHRRAGGSR
jgi:carnitine-CoA ligase